MYAEYKETLVALGLSANIDELWSVFCRPEIEEILDIDSLTNCVKSTWASKGFIRTEFDWNNIGSVNEVPEPHIDYPGTLIEEGALSRAAILSYTHEGSAELRAVCAEPAIDRFTLLGLYPQLVTEHAQITDKQGLIFEDLPPGVIVDQYDLATLPTVPWPGLHATKQLGEVNRVATITNIRILNKPS